MDWLSWNNIAREFVAWMGAASVRAVVLGLLALLLISFVRRRSSAQHAMWTLVLAGMLVLPFLRQVIPATHVQLEVLAPQIAQARPVLRVASACQFLPRQQIRDQRLLHFGHCSPWRRIWPVCCSSACDWLAAC